MTKISLLFFLLILTTSYAQEDNKVASLNIEAILKPTNLFKNKDFQSELTTKKENKLKEEKDLLNNLDSTTMSLKKEKTVRKYRESNREPRYDMF